MATSEKPSSIYADFVSTVGRQSPLAKAEVSRLSKIVEAPRDSNFDRRAFFHDQDVLYEQKNRGEITLDELLDRVRELSKHAHEASRYRTAIDRLAAFPIIARIDNYADSDTMTAVNALVGRLRSPAKITNRAPFGDYADNTDESWKWVEDEYTRDFLESRLFVNDNELYGVASGSTDSNTHLMRYGYSESNFRVPTDLVINAIGFSSWLGRENKLGRKGMGEKYIALDPTARSISYTAIKAYAGHPTELPPVTKLDVFVQPNGLAFASNGSGGGDSHRIAAAILRGEKTVQSEQLGIVLLKDNVLDTLTQTPSS